MRRRTHIAQRLPEDYEDKVTEFQRFIITQRNRDNYEANQIGNADQTPLTFDIPHTTTIDTKGTSTVNIKMTGNEKNRFTVMLACTADGGKLPPFIIFKRKTMPKEEFPPGVIVRNHEKGWMDEALTLDWIKSVWGKRPGADKKSLLVLDAFQGHKTDKTKRALKQKNTTLAIIPGGMTSILQSLDVSINKPMKSSLRRRWNDWMISGTHTYTKSGLRRKPDLPTICQWILDMWRELPSKIIVKASRSVGFLMPWMVPRTTAYGRRRTVKMIAMERKTPNAVLTTQTRTFRGRRNSMKNFSTVRVKRKNSKDSWKRTSIFIVIKQSC